MDEVFVVFGGLGLVGRALTRRLRAPGIPAVVVDKKALNPPNVPPPGVSVFRADVSDPDQVASFAEQLPDGAVFVNLAARQYHAGVPRAQRQHWFNAVNLNGASHVADLAIRKRAAGLVQFSSDMVYGLPRNLPVTEEHPRQPIGEYGLSKKLMEAMLTEKAGEAGLRLTIFRPRLIAGPGRLGVLVKLFRLVRHHLPVPLIGAGRNCYQMVSAEDCAHAVLLAHKHRFPEGSFNLGSTPGRTVRDLMQDLARHAGSRSPIVRTHARSMHAALAGLALVGIEPLYREQYLLADKDFIVDTTRAREILGWRASQSDRDMLLAAYDHWLQGQVRRYP